MKIGSMKRCLYLYVGEKKLRRHQRIRFCRYILLLSLIRLLCLGITYRLSEEYLNLKIKQRQQVNVYRKPVISKLLLPDGFPAGDLAELKEPPILGPLRLGMSQHLFSWCHKLCRYQSAIVSVPIEFVCTCVNSQNT